MTALGRNDLFTRPRPNGRYLRYPAIDAGGVNAGSSAESRNST
jgi:hypothetical protein